MNNYISSLCLRCGYTERYKTSGINQVFALPVCAYCTDHKPRWIEAWVDLYAQQADRLEDAELLLANDCEVHMDKVYQLTMLERQNLAKTILVELARTQ